MNRWTKRLLWSSLLVVGVFVTSSQSHVIATEQLAEAIELTEAVASEVGTEGIVLDRGREVAEERIIASDVVDDNLLASPVEEVVVEEQTKRYDILYEEEGHYYYYEPEFYGGILARNKWSYSPSKASWYFSDINGRVNQVVSQSSYTRNGIQETDIVVTINNKQLYYEPSAWGGQQARSKWSYSPSAQSWYYSDVKGWINQIASPAFYTRDGVKETDSVVTINGSRLYYEPSAWGGQQARSKWPYSPSAQSWYYSDVKGWINQVASRSSYIRKGMRETDAIVTINGAQLYYEPSAWGGHQARNKWSYSPNSRLWYYSDVNGIVTQAVKSRDPYDVKVTGIDAPLYLGKTLAHAKMDKAQTLFGQKFSVGQTVRHGLDYLVEIKRGDTTIGYLPSSAVVTVPKNKRTIYLDSGHGGSELGAFKFGVAEKDLNLQITVPLAKRLRELGYIVYESRVTDKEIPLRQRQIEPNQLMPDIYVSIHHNAMPDSYGGRAKGILSLYHDRSIEEPGYMTMPYHPESKIVEGKRLAVTIQAALEKETGAPTQGTRAQNLHVTRTTDVPAALIELGFMDNWEEFQRLTNPAYQQKLINGLIKGINTYFANVSN